MQQLAALLSTSPAETFDQLRLTYDGTLSVSDYNELIENADNDPVTSKSPAPVSPSSGHHHRMTASSTANTSFTIESILSSSPQRRNHSDDHQHQQLDKYHHVRHHTANVSPRISHSATSIAVQMLPALPISRAFYG